MTKLFDHLGHVPFARLSDLFQRGSQLVFEIGWHTDRLPIQIAIPFAKPFQFTLGEIGSSVKGLQPLDQKLVPFHLAEFDPRVEARRVLVPRVSEPFEFVPVEGLKCCYKKSLTELLTFGQGKLQLCDPLLITQVWPLVTIDADDASPRCSSIAWLYSPDLGTFPAESPSLSGCIRQLCFAREKSLRIEVEDGH